MIRALSTYTGTAADHFVDMVLLLTVVTLSTCHIMLSFLDTKSSIFVLKQNDRK